MATAERQDYPAMLAQVQPGHASSILNDRVQQIGRLNAAIADWLQERRRVEEQYAAGLRRLAQKQLEGVDLGIFSGPWTTLTGSLDLLAESHSTLATKIEVDVERPLRDFAGSNREMSAMTTVQGNLGALAKDVERAQQKTDKLKGKGERADEGKIANANTDLDTAQAQWESLAPPVFSNLQSIDETRLAYLRDALTQYQTHEMDQLERSRVSGEQCLNVLLNVETADEIKTFALKAVQTRPTLARPQRGSLSYTTPSRSGPADSPSALAPSLSRSEDDFPRERQGSTEDKSKSRLKGLRRLGTVMGRKRESKLPAITNESPDTRPRISPMNSSRFGRSRDNTSTLETMPETSPRQRPSAPPQLGSEIFAAPSEVRADPSTPPSSSRDGLSLPQLNGTPFSAFTQPGSSSGLANGGHENDLSGLDPPEPVYAQRKESLRALEGLKDSEGYTLPPQNLDPISQAQQDAALADEGSAPALNVNIRDAPIQEDSVSDSNLAGMANKLQLPPPTTKRASTIRGRRADRNSTMSSMFSPAAQSIPEPVPASASTTRDASDSAFAQSDPSEAPSTNVADSGLTMSPSSTFGSTVGQLSASTFSPFTPSERQSPSRLDSRTATSPDLSKLDSQSIRSATTTSSQGGSRHPELTESGLNTSIVETVSARFESGRIVSASLIGEIALAYNPTDFSSPLSTENIRLENFAGLEKVAPNPAFINPIPDKSGEYSVNLSSIAKTQVAFKYQVRLDDAGAQAPLLITPALKIEANQCSVIVSYSLNPAFALNGQDSIVLSNAMIALTIGGTSTASCQSRPVGTFSREKNLIWWPLNEVKLVAGAAPAKLLARFATESEVTGASVEARWEINTTSNTANVGSALSVSMQSSSGGAGEGSDPFADESAQQGAAAWKTVNGVRKLTSGSYIAK